MTKGMKMFLNLKSTRNQISFKAFFISKFHSRKNHLSELNFKNFDNSLSEKFERVMVMAQILGTYLTTQFHSKPL